MNGRMYDAVLGRMLSPDKYVQDGTNTQAYNRYSYVMNNPLKYTDPSGWLRLADAPVEANIDDTRGGSGGGSRYIGGLDLTGGVSGYNYMGSYSMYVSSPDFYAAIYGTQTWMQSATNKAYIMSCIRDAINMLNGPSQVHIRRKGNTGLPGEVRDVKPRTWYFGSDDNQNDLDMNNATAGLLGFNGNNPFKKAYEYVYPGRITFVNFTQTKFDNYALIPENGNQPR